jgi:LSD1 subclass zinc finger protein
MKLLALNCNRCGAPLEVPEKAKFVTCTFCQTQLAVQRSGGAAYTEALEKLDERTEQIADDVEILKLQAELDRLDREWTSGRERYMRADNNGVMSVPTRAGALAVMLISTVGGIAFTAFSSTMMAASAGFGMEGPFFDADGNPFHLDPSHSAPDLFSSIFPMFGLAFVAFGLFIGFSGLKKADQYEQAQRAYEEKRRELLQRISG